MAEQAEAIAIKNCRHDYAGAEIVTERGTPRRGDPQEHRVVAIMADEQDQ